MRKWSIIIFCYNEEAAIEQVILKALEFLNANGSAGSELLMVDDGSTDRSAEIMAHWSTQDPRIKLIRHPVNKGIGAALKAGYDAAKGDWVCAVPGDGQFDVFELASVPVLTPNTFISFYRRDKRYNAYRKLLTIFNNLFNRYLLGIYLRDVNWIKVYSIEQLRFVEYSLNSSLIESEISAKLLKSGYTAIEIPSEYRLRLGGSPKGGGWKTLRKAAAEMLALAKLVRTFRKAPSLPKAL
jgi:glycosyltransferase involved in cell wall biosynthesis